jgi:RNA polymerase sigma-70 factor (ECF subfamily)
MAGMSSDLRVHDAINDVYLRESRRVYATLVRVLGSFDLAEEALNEAFLAAVEKWRSDGIPENPRAWLVSTGKFKAIDLIRRRARFQELQPELVRRVDEIQDANRAQGDEEIEDDRLRLIFTCCHPAIDPSVQAPLTLREVCGLTTEEIAHAFLTTPPTMAQRIVRGKAKIRDANIPFAIPAREELPERLDAVLSVIYLVYNEGYSASMGQTLLRTDLADEAIRLARLVLQLLPDAEVMGLLALMLLHESRRAARISTDGDIVLLEDQDRSRWNAALIDEGRRLVQQAFAADTVGVYSIQAAISAVHAAAASAAETEWGRIVGLYDLLLQAGPSPVVELNRAVAVAMRDGPAAGLAIIDGIFARGELAGYHLAHSARGELLRRLGESDAAQAAFERALSLAKQEPETRFLQRKLAALRGEG